MDEKIFCANGHLIGKVTAEGLFIQHQKRKISVLRAKNEAISIVIKCDRCGSETEMRLVSQNVVDI